MTTNHWEKLEKSLMEGISSWQYQEIAVSPQEELAMRRCLEMFGGMLMYAVQFDEFNFSDADVELVNEAVDALFKYIHIQNARKAQRRSIKSNDGIIKAIECKLGTGMVDSHGNEIFEGDDVRVLGDGRDEVLKVTFRKGAFFLGDLLLMDYLAEFLSIVTPLNQQP